MRIFTDELRLESTIIREKLSDRELALSLLKLVFIVFLVFLLSNLVAYLYTTPDAMLKLLDTADAFGPLIIVLLIMLEVVIAPIPGFVVMVAAGYVYGPFWGTLYSYAGNVLGSLLAFVLARHFGRPFVRRIISRRLLDRYDEFFNGHKKSLMLFYALPIVPVDILSFVCGLSDLRWRRFLLVIMVGFIPNTLVLALVGDRLSQLSFALTVVYVLVFLLVFSGLALLFRYLVKRLSPR